MVATSCTVHDIHLSSNLFVYLNSLLEAGAYSWVVLAPLEILALERINFDHGYDRFGYFKCTPAFAVKGVETDST